MEKGASRINEKVRTKKERVSIKKQRKIGLSRAITREN